MSITTQDFWQFSLDIYQIETLQMALLNAQDNQGLNVNLALFCLFLNKRGVYLTLTQVSQLDKALTSFSAKFTKPLRQLRQTFKAQQHQLDNYLDVRQAMLKTELLLEQQEQNLLVQTLSTLHLSSCSSQDNLALYQDLLSTQNTTFEGAELNLSDLNQYIL